MKHTVVSFTTARLLRDEDGVVAIVVALCMVVLLGFTALVLDSGYLFLERTQLQKAADAAALAGAFDIWPGNGTNNSIAANSATDAAKFATLNGANPTTVVSSAASCAPVGSTCWVGSTGGQAATVYDPGDAWQVTIARSVPLVFAPILGIPSSTVTVTAVALNSPLSSCDAACILPYAIWGGNNPIDNPGSPFYSDDANRWCAGETPNVPAPCNTPSTAPTGVSYTIPSGQTQYNYQDLCQSTTVSSCGSIGSATIIYRDNSWTSDTVFPNPNKCGGNNQIPCSANWNRNASTAFNGFFNNVSTTLTTDSSGAFWSKSGNSTGTEPWARICSLAASGGDGIFPVVDRVTVDSNSGNTVFHLANFVALKLVAPSGCSGGNQMGQSPFTGTVDWGATIPHGRGGGTNKTSAVHVLQLWQ